MPLTQEELAILIKLDKEGFESTLGDVKGKTNQFATEIEDGFNKSEKAARKFGDNIAQVKDGLIVMVAGIAAVVSTFGNWVRAQNESIEADERLILALKNSGQYTAESKSAIDSYVESLSKKIKVDDDEIKVLAARALAMGVSKDKLQETLPLVYDLAKSYKIDINTALKTVNQLQNDQIAGIGRLVPELKNYEDQGLSAADALNKLKESTAGYAQKMAEASGGQQELTMNIGNFGEFLGKLVKPLVDWFVGRINDLFNMFEKLNPTMKAVIGSLVIIGTTIGSFALIGAGLIAVITGLQGAFTALGVAIGVASIPIMPIVIAIGVLTAAGLTLGIVLNEMRPPTEKLASVNQELEAINAKLADSTAKLTEEERKNLTQRRDELIKTSKEYTDQINKQHDATIASVDAMKKASIEAKNAAEAQNELANVNYSSSIEGMKNLSKNAQEHLKKYGNEIKDINGKVTGFQILSESAFFKISETSKTNMEKTAESIKTAIDSGVVKSQEIAPLIGENLVNGAFPISSLNQLGKKARDAIYDWIYSGAIDSATTLEELDTAIITQIDRIGKYYDALIAKANKGLGEFGVPLLKVAQKLEEKIVKMKAEAKKVDLQKKNTSGYTGDTAKYSSGDSKTETPKQETPGDTGAEQGKEEVKIVQEKENAKLKEIDAQIELNREKQKTMELDKSAYSMFGKIDYANLKREEIAFIKSRDAELDNEIEKQRNFNAALTVQNELQAIFAVKEKEKADLSKVTGSVMSTVNKAAEKEADKIAQAEEDYQKRASAGYKKLGEEIDANNQKQEEFLETLAKGADILETFVSDIASGNGIGNAIGGLTENLVSTIGAAFGPGGEAVASIVNSVIGIAESILEGVIAQTEKQLAQMSENASADAALFSAKGQTKEALQAELTAAMATETAARQKAEERLLHHPVWSWWDELWTGKSKADIENELKYASAKTIKAQNELTDYMNGLNEESYAKAGENFDLYWEKVKAAEEAEIERQKEITAELENQKRLVNEKLQALIGIGALDVQNIGDIQKIQQATFASGYSGVEALQQLKGLGVSGGDYSRSIGQLTVQTTINGANVNEFMKNLSAMTAEAVLGK